MLTHRTFPGSVRACRLSDKVGPKGNDKMCKVRGNAKPQRPFRGRICRCR